MEPIRVNSRIVRLFRNSPYPYLVTFNEIDMCDWKKKAAITKYLPKGKKELSLDAVELLLGLVYDQAEQDVQDAERERNRKPEGPYEID